MPENPNPYASPSPIPHNQPSQPTDPLDPLRGPSLGLFLSSGLVIAGGIVLLPSLLLELAQGGDVSVGVFLLPMFLASFPILVGAWNMRYGTRYRWAYAAAVLASIPMLTPAMWCGVPLGIWTLLVLHRKDIKMVFAARTENVATVD